MIEVFQESIKPYNLPYTVCLGFMLLYWVMVIVGALDIEIFDFDIDLESDFFDFLNIGIIPVTVILSFMIIEMWMGALIIHYFFRTGLLTSIPFWIFNIGLFIILFFGSLFLTALLFKPVAKCFQPEKTLNNKDIVGKTCKILSSTVNNSFGTAEFQDENVSLNISVRSKKKFKLNKNDIAVINGYDPKKNIYYIIPFNE